MSVRWSQADRDAVLDAIRADLTADEIVEIESYDDEAFGRFVSLLFAAVKDQLDD